MLIALRERLVFACWLGCRITGLSVCTAHAADALSGGSVSFKWVVLVAEWNKYIGRNGLNTYTLLLLYNHNLYDHQR